MWTWWSGMLFRKYLRWFLLLWIAGKIANAATAAYVQLPPYGFRLGTELFICAFELVALFLFMRAANEDILLGNLGIRVTTALAPLVILHLALSAVLATIAT